MFLQSNLTNRRKFLQRSVLGAGSIFLSSSLLQSCTLQDHNIPPIKPPLGADAADWNELAKDAITDAISAAVPEGGEILSGVIDVLWPNSGSGPWDQVKAQVQALVDQKFDDFTYTQAKGALDSLNLLIGDYLNAIKDNGDVSDRWISVHEVFVGSRYLFTTAGYEVLLLPLYAQYTNMFLALLRDAVLHGNTWAMKPGDVQQAQTDLTSFIAEAVNYVSGWYTSSRANVVGKTKRDDVTCEPFRTVNTFDRQMTMLVLDYMDSWPYYDVSIFPNGPKKPDNTPIYLFTREIYSDPFGNILNVDNYANNPLIELPTPATQFPTYITVWGGHRIDAVQLTYPAGGGPGGVDYTVRMGDKIGGTNAFPLGGIFNVSPDAPFVRVLVTYGIPISGTMAIYTLQFIDANGTYTQQMGGQKGVGGYTGEAGYDNYALSSIYIHGINLTIQNSADCIVFGFMRWPRK
ncbi:insecticidal delta-endotoxin Cry8Ea1 family protein [Larkinella sp. C7]|uniref:insecticidal delta-endotoxin Cry8Ea1 family protein n=1 Tax=Larkinella sp. C7 TaxID=2576607 RepID=UPI0011114739|nr:insecticidal delta-endotoxin Cry8Ea1 family protein [Larkinella sp. C7]